MSVKVWDGTKWASEVPAGGTAGQVLSKASATDGDVAWADAAAGGGGATNPVTDPVFFDDFWGYVPKSGVPTGANYPGLIWFGTGAVSNQMFDPSSGCVMIDTGTAAAGEVQIYLPNTLYQWGDGIWYFETMLNVRTLSDATETFAFSAGIGWRGYGGKDSIAFVYDAQGKIVAPGSPNWQCHTQTSGSAAVHVDSGVPVVASGGNATVPGAWVRFRIEMDKASSAARFFIQDQLVHTATVTAWNLGNPQLHIYKYLGTASRIVYSDYFLLGGHTVRNG